MDARRPIDPLTKAVCCLLALVLGCGGAEPNDSEGGGPPARHREPEAPTAPASPDEPLPATIVLRCASHDDCALVPGPCGPFAVLAADAEEIRRRRAARADDEPQAQVECAEPIVDPAAICLRGRCEALPERSYCRDATDCRALPGPCGGPTLANRWSESAVRAEIELRARVVNCATTSWPPAALTCEDHICGLQPLEDVDLRQPCRRDAQCTTVHDECAGDLVVAQTRRTQAEERLAARAAELGPDRCVAPTRPPVPLCSFGSCVPAPEPEPVPTELIEVERADSGWRFTRGDEVIDAPDLPNGDTVEVTVTSLETNGDVPLVYLRDPSSDSASFFVLRSGRLEGVHRAGTWTGIPLPAGGGRSVSFRLLDLDGDGIRELVAYLRINEGDTPAVHTSRTVYAWTGETFAPVERRDAPTSARPWTRSTSLEMEIRQRLHADEIWLDPPTSVFARRADPGAIVTTGVGLHGGGELFVGRDFVAYVQARRGTEWSLHLISTRETERAVELQDFVEIGSRFRGDWPPGIDADCRLMLGARNAVRSHEGRTNLERALVASWQPRAGMILARLVRWSAQGRLEPLGEPLPVARCSGPTQDLVPVLGDALAARRTRVPTGYITRWGGP